MSSQGAVDNAMGLSVAVLIGLRAATTQITCTSGGRSDSQRAGLVFGEQAIVAFLVGDEASYISGETIYVADGPPNSMIIAPCNKVEPTHSHGWIDTTGQNS
jgi:hypothetical protein